MYCLRCDKISEIGELCYHKSTNKGSYTIGRGYTRYYDDFLCGTRHAHGCPRARKDNQLCQCSCSVRPTNNQITCYLDNLQGEKK